MTAARADVTSDVVDAPRVAAGPKGRHGATNVRTRAVPLLLLVIAGCGSAVESGHSTALSGLDLQTMTDAMAQSIAGDPDVQRAIEREGRLRIVVQPVENNLTAEILPAGQARAYTARVRTLLSRHAPDQFQWLMNRDEFYQLRGRELDNVDPGPAPDRVQPRYALEARFSSLTNETSKGRSVYYLCVYQLTDLEGGGLLWTDKYELKKTAVKGFLD